MSDQRQRDGVDSRIAGKLAAGELWKLFVVTLGQIASDLAELFLDDMKVVYQPLGGGRYRAVASNRVGEYSINGKQLAAVILQPRQKTTAATWIGGHLVLSG